MAARSTALSYGLDERPPFTQTLLVAIQRQDLDGLRLGIIPLAGDLAWHRVQEADEQGDHDDAAQDQPEGNDPQGRWIVHGALA
jgi:hypothetical protein